MRIYGLVLVGALSIGSAAHAQSIIDAELSVPTYLQTASTFTLTSASSLFIEGAAPSNAQIEGTGFLSQGGALLDTFALTNGSGSVLFNQFNLAAGTYTFQYDFSNSTPTIGGSVYLSANVVPMAAPEIDPSSAMAGLTLLAGGIATLRGRRIKPKAA
jgi:hypothetical protein